MPYNPYENYLESQVLSASPLQLVSILYGAAIDALNSARMHLASANIPSRTQASTRAQAILAELTQAVDRQRGGEVAANLVELYSYILRRVHEANFQGDDAAYVEAIKLLTTLLDGWQEVQEPVVASISPPSDASMAQHAPIECSF